MLPQLKMQLWLIDGAGGADLANRLALSHGVAPLYSDAVGMSVGAGPAIGMLDQHQIAKTGQSIACIGNRAISRGPDWGAACCRNVNAIIVKATGFRAKVR